MKRFLGGAAVVILLLLALGAIYIHQRVTQLDVTQLTPDVWAISGLGGNVGVLRTDQGAVVVDTMTFRTQGARILEKSDELAGPIQAIVNTHYDFDHTHGNPAFPVGTKVIATDRTLGYLKRLDADYWQGDAAALLPNETFHNERDLHIANKTVRLIHPGRGHTDGDLVVLFVEDRVLHTGDLFCNGRYPNIDLEAGGSVREWAATIDRLLELDFDQVIPGHGPVTDREGLRAFQSFMRELAEAGEQASREGWSLEEMEERADVDADAGYEVVSIPLVMRLDRQFVLRRTWEEATGHVNRVELPGDTE